MQVKGNQKGKDPDKIIDQFLKLGKNNPNIIYTNVEINGVKSEKTKPDENLRYINKLKKIISGIIESIFGDVKIKMKKVQPYSGYYYHLYNMVNNSNYGFYIRIGNDLEILMGFSNDNKLRIVDVDSIVMLEAIDLGNPNFIEKIREWFEKLSRLKKWTLSMKVFTKQKQ